MKFVGKVKTMGNMLMVEAPRYVSIPDGEYQLDIRDAKNLKRSDRQNSMMWGIVNQIAKKLDGNTSGAYGLYCQILEMSGIPYWEYRIDDRALDNAKKLLKHVKVVSQDIEGDRLMDNCWVFPGISEMTTGEASQLIDTVKWYASEVGIDVDEDYWKEMLR